MTNTIKTVAMWFLLTAWQTSFAQNTNQEKAVELGIEAVKLMDNGEIDKSIQLLKEAKKLDPQNMDFPYEIAYAQYLKKDYKSSIKTLKAIVNHPNVNDKVYQLLGNSYSVSGQPEKAIEWYEKGLEKFPNSGKLYLERGNIHLFNGEYGKALVYYELGIELDPEFSSNYYWATKIYCNSQEEVWGMIYGEIFINLEKRNYKRIEEISELLFKTYKSEIQLKNDTSISVSFCNNTFPDIQSINITDSNNLKLPFSMIYEQTLLLSLISVKNIDVSSLSQVRSKFIDHYFNANSDKSYPNILFSFQKKLKDSGHFEAYNYWVMRKGDEESFYVWKSQNKEKWDAFVKWSKSNPFVIDYYKRFYRGQYK